jgi:hypothetical protein
MNVPETLKPSWRLLPEGALAAGVVVCEQSGLWAVGLRRELETVAAELTKCPAPGDLTQAAIPGGRLGVWETRTLAEAVEALSRSPASLAVIELSLPRLERLLAWLPRLERDFPLAQAAVVADRSLADYEGLMREAGAIYFTTTLRRLTALAEIAMRHAARSPQAPANAVKQIWAGLPWGKE